MYISIDLGRSTTRIASTLDLKSILKIVKFPTEGDLNLQKANMAKAFIEVAGDNEIDAIAFGFPGVTDKLKEVFEKSANYPQIEGLNIKSFLPEKYLTSKDIIMLIYLGYFYEKLNNLLEKSKKVNEFYISENEESKLLRFSCLCLTLKLTRFENICNDSLDITNS